MRTHGTFVLAYLVPALLSFSLCWQSTPAAAGDCENEINKAAQKHGVPVEVLQAVGETETGRGDGLRANALNVAGRSHYDLTPEEAKRIFADASRRGIKLIDVGCMQINHHYHKQHFTSVSDMLEPARNVDYAARFLRELYQEENNWTVAVARYHAGKRNQPAQRRYVCAVIGKLIAAGKAAWTNAARTFCGEHQKTISGNQSIAQGKVRAADNGWTASVRDARTATGE